MKLFLLALCVGVCGGAPRAHRRRRAPPPPHSPLVSATSACQHELSVWPAPANVTCSDLSDAQVKVDASTFSIVFSPNSQAQSSIRLQKAMDRARDKVMSQPTRLTRGLDEPQFTFPSDDDDDNVDGSAELSSAPPRVRSLRGDPLKLGGVALTIAADEQDGAPPPSLGEDESYSLSLAVDEEDPSALTLELASATVWGALQGLETIAQLVRADGVVPGGTDLRIEDAPRYPWRGLLLDTSNHFLPVEQLLTFLDAMAAVKMNVLHWHIVDSYSFPFESVTFPDLSAYGAWTSDAVYNASAVEQVVAYAADRAIRVVPEFDVPGHAYSWGLSKALADITVDCPLYANGLGHVDDVPLDPTNDLTYEVVKGVLSDAADAFPDKYLHLGGDELQYGCWNESAGVRRWLSEHEGSSMVDLENEFFGETASHLAKLGKKQLVWEEVFFKDGSPEWIPSPVLLANDTVIETWTGPEYLPVATSNGYDAILAYGWYLDRQTPVDGEVAWGWLDSWSQMYAVEPEPLSRAQPEARAAGRASAGERTGRVLGGEASLWSEQVDVVNALVQAWPRAAAVAERLWSPRDVDDLADAARRLADLRCRLVHWHGVQSAPVWSDFCSAAGLHVPK
jgi:hexosaminidase